MIDYEYYNLFDEDSVDKQFYIEYAGGTITNEDLFSESIEIIENLCSEIPLRFGCCEASSLKFKVGNVYNLPVGTELTVSVSLSENRNDPFINDPKTSSRFVIGKYRVFENVLTADKMWREITAYDAMQGIIDADMAAWYNGILPNENSTVTAAQFRQSFANYFGLEEVLPAEGLINDNETITRTVAPEQISGKDILTAFCEFNGCFAHIGRDGKLHYIYLPQAIEGLYPAKDLYPDHAPDHLPQSETGHLYPQKPKSISIGANQNYIECNYEDFIVKSITRLQIRGSEDDIGSTYPEGEIAESDNVYVIEDNFLLYGKSHEDLQRISARIFGKISGITYRPYSLKIRANPCLEVGDPVRIPTKYCIIESYVLNRTMSGLQAFVDTQSAEGTEKYTEKVNSVQRSITKLKGKTNTLVRTVDETRSELKDLEISAETRFLQTAQEIRAEAIRAQAEEERLDASVSLTASGLQTEINRAKGVEEQISTSLSATAEGIRAQISAETSRAQEEESKLSNSITVTSSGLTADIVAEKNRAQGEESRLSTSISATAEEIRAEVTRAQGAEQTLSSSIAQTASQIALKVSKGDVSSQLSLESGRVQIDSDRLIVNSTDFILGSDGKMHSSGGTVGGWTISNAKIYNADASYGECVAMQKTAYNNTYAFVAGANYHNDYSTGRFRVRHDGKTYIDDLSVGHIGDELYMYRDYQKLEALSAWYGGGYELHVGDGFSQVDIGSLDVQRFVDDNPIFEVAINDSAISGTYDAVFGQNGRLRKKSESSERFKHDITKSLKPDLDPHRLLDIGIYQFKYNSDYLDHNDERFGRDVIGFISEDVNEKYPIACSHDQFGRPSNWDARYMIPPMLSILQEQSETIRQLRFEMFALRGELETIKTM